MTTDLNVNTAMITTTGARSFLVRAGARARMSGIYGKPRIEAKVPGSREWQYVAAIVKREVCAAAVYFWVDQNIVH